MRIRLFVALILNNHILDEIIKFRENIYPNNEITKWENKEKLHITLKFLGEVEEDNIPQIVNKLGSTINLHDKIEIYFSNIRIIYKYSIPKILWLGVKLTQQLNKLYLDINNILNDVGFENEKRKFNPHITLLRIKGNEDISKLEMFAKEEIKLKNTFANEVALIKSVLYKNGSEYTKIKSFNLNTGGFNG